MSQPFQEPILPFLTFCGPSPNFEGNGPKGPPYFDPCVIGYSYLLKIAEWYGNVIMSAVTMYSFLVNVAECMLLGSMLWV